MKAINRFLQGAVVSSVLVSCNTDEVDELARMNENDQLENQVSMQRSENTLISIRYDLNEKQRDSLLFLTNLGIDLFKNRQEAQKFSANPDEYMRNKGYVYEINIDDGLIKLYKAFADDDVYNALSMNDIKLYFKLCKERGYLDSNNFSSVFFKNATSTLSSYGPTSELVLLLPLAIGAYLYYTYYYYYHFKTEVITETSVVYSKMATFPSALIIGDLQNNPEATYAACMEYIDDEINNIIEMTKELTPERIPDEKAEEEYRNYIKVTFGKFFQ
jgi:hypothetical protein